MPKNKKIIHRKQARRARHKQRRAKAKQSFKHRQARAGEYQGRLRIAPVFNPRPMVTRGRRVMKIARQRFSRQKVV